MPPAQCRAVSMQAKAVPGQLRERISTARVCGADGLASLLVRSACFLGRPRADCSNTPLLCSHIYRLINIDTLGLIAVRDWEETPGRADAKTARAVMLTYFAEFHEIENQGAADKRPQIAAHM